MNIKDSYQLEITKLGKALFYTFCKIFKRKYQKSLNNILKDSEKKSVKKFLELKGGLEQLDLNIFEAQIPSIWFNDYEEKSVINYYHQNGFEDIYLEGLINTFKYYKTIVRKFLEPESTLLALKKNAMISKEIFQTDSDQIFDHYQSHPDILKTYSKGFAGSHLIADLEIINKEIFLSSDKVLDLGGGFGHFGELLRKNNNFAYYLVLDLPGMYKIFKKRIENNSSRFQGFEYISGNFFQEKHEIPELGDRKFDSIILGWILHDWNDEKCDEILLKLKKYLSKKGKIVILESIHNHLENRSLFLDWIIFVMAEGFERTKEDYLKMFKRVGYKLVHVNNEKMKRSVLCIEML